MSSSTARAAKPARYPSIPSWSRSSASISRSTRQARTGVSFTGPRGGIFKDRAYLKIFHKARAAAFTPAESESLLAWRPYDLRHAAVSTWLNAGVPAPQVADWAGHSVDVLLRVYAKCISGQQAEAKRRIEEATQPRDDE